MLNRPARRCRATEHGGPAVDLFIETKERLHVRP